ncbi:MAG TPA: carbohydrate ABC transporter permease [Candidatus Sumerlaeota bacterium]|nr:carbohydrate ABC transporter permease [Candidatus Sumerlaeota bacterium]
MSGRKAFPYLLLVVGSACFVMPLLIMLLTSVKPSGEVMAIPPRLLPSELRWDNYSEAFKIVDFKRHYLNSIFVVSCCVVGNVLTAALCAFGFARLRAPGRDKLFMLFLATIMLPPQVTMVPVFIMFSKLGWVNSYKPLIIPAFLSGGAFNVFLLRQFFMTIPRELEEAAEIDGCSRFGIFWRIFVPLSRPALITVGIFAFMTNWNDFISPLIYLHDQEKYTLALSLNLFKGMLVSKTPWGPLMAASAMMILPLVVLFFALQRYFVQGVTVTGLKS